MMHNHHHHHIHNWEYCFHCGVWYCTTCGEEKYKCVFPQVTWGDFRPKWNEQIILCNHAH